MKAKADMAHFDETRIKEVLLRERGPCDNCQDSIRVVPSPNGDHALVFSHGNEVSMMNWSYSATLFDRSLKSLERFDSLDFKDNDCAWSADSSLFAVMYCDTFSRLLVWNPSGRRFAVVSVSYPGIVFRFEASSLLHIQMHPDQLRAMNSQKVFESGKAVPPEVPVQRFKAPVDVAISVARLLWHSQSELGKIKEFVKSAQVVNMGYVPDGHFPFHGKLPESTTDVFYLKPIRVKHLEAFANYGDRQSQIWLAEVKKIVGGDRNAWANAYFEPVEKFLGVRQRTVPSGL